MSHPRLLLTFVATTLCAGAATAQASTVELKKAALVYAAPSKDADEIGRIASRTRVSVLDSREGRDCRYRWRRIEPRGWICTKTTPTRRQVTTQRLPLLKDGELPVGRYGRVSKKSGAMVYQNLQAAKLGEGALPDKSLSVLRKSVRTIDGKRFWQTSEGRLIESRFIRRYQPSKYKGVESQGDGAQLRLPVAWARPSKKEGRVEVRAAPSMHAALVDELVAKTQVEFLEESPDHKFVRIGKGRWILRSESRRAAATPRPKEVAAHEVWLDVDMQEQVLVAYRGDKPLYATMISTGTRKHRTPPGKYRIQRKVAQKTMASGETSKEQYSVGGVPWVMYVHGTYALHGAYWHDRVGAPRSHGCVNLAPKDAQQIYGMVQPEVPAGWISANATADAPGTFVHLRSPSNPVASARIRYQETESRVAQN